MAFDSKQHEYKDIKLVIAGEEITGFTGIKFKVSREKEYLRGRGDKPHEIQHGDIDYEGEVMIWQSTLERLIELAPGGDITLLRFQMIVMFASKRTDKVSGWKLDSCEINEFELGMSTGDKRAEISLPLMFLDLEKVV